jgi:nucleotide-binding universal stress UspA family protein
MLDHILIPLDGSKLAEEAVAYGKQILPKGGKITLITALHVSESWMYGVDPLVVSAEYRRSIDQMEQSAKAYLQRIAVGLEADGFQVATLLEYGPPAPVILNYAIDANVDAIVMSTHGRSGISRWLFGSVTNKVLSEAPCPVFVVPSKAAEQSRVEIIDAATTG